MITMTPEEVQLITSVKRRASRWADTGKYVDERLNNPTRQDAINCNIHSMYCNIRDAAERGGQTAEIKHPDTDMQEALAKHFRDKGFDVIHTETGYIVSWK